MKTEPTKVAPGDDLHLTVQTHIELVKRYGAMMSSDADPDEVVPYLKAVTESAGRLSALLPEAEQVATPHWIDEKALEVARRFTGDHECQRRASLQCAVIDAMQFAGQRQAGQEAAGCMVIVDGEIDDFEAYQGVKLPDGDYALYTAPPAAQVPAWISVKDRLPLEGDGAVAVLMDDGSVLTAWASYWHGASSAFAQWMHPVDVDDAQVAYWCPLPEPIPF